MDHYLGYERYKIFNIFEIYQYELKKGSLFDHSRLNFVFNIVQKRPS